MKDKGHSSTIAKRGILAILLVMLLSAPVVASDLYNLWETYERGDYATALKELRPLAEQGDAYAQGILGLMYDHGGATQPSRLKILRNSRAAFSTSNQ